MKKLSIILLFLAMFLSSQAFGITINFGDNSNYWPGWNNVTSDDSQDTIGIPSFTGGTATLSNTGKLIGLTFGQSTASSSLWGVLSSGDLFINTNADGYWDYFVDLTSWIVSGHNNPDPGAGNYNIYSIHMALGDKNNNPGYILSGTDNSNGWSGYYIRNNHPVAYGGTLGQAYGQVYFSGWTNTPATEYTFNFTSLADGGLALGQDFTIGWAVNCANDVVYETMHNPVPEPATMLLLGSGLIGLAGFARRRFLKK